VENLDIDNILENFPECTNQSWYKIKSPYKFTNEEILDWKYGNDYYKFVGIEPTP
jgi:hypothetical protein